MAQVESPDEMDRLMPRTKAARERASMNSDGVRRYRDINKISTVARRTNLHIRSDIRRDADGFEDIDDFWAEDDASFEQDDDLMSTSDREPSMGSSHPNRYSSISARSSLAPSTGGGTDDDNGPDFDDDDAPDVGGDMDIDSDSNTNAESGRRSSVRPSVTKRVSIQSPKKSFHLSDDENESPRNSMIAPSRPSSSRPSDTRSMSYGSDDVPTAPSPFPDDDPLSPVSNASDHELASIDSFSADGDSIDFTGEQEKPKSKPKARTTKAKASKPFKPSKPAPKPAPKAAPKAKKPRFIKTSPIKRKKAAASTSAPDELTDQDKSFQASSDEESHLNDSIVSDKDPNATEGAADLSHAYEVLQDGDGDENSGLRRSKRRRFKPLEWYKGEHYVFERRHSGVGLIVPTVAGIERLGAKLDDDSEVKRQNQRKVRTRRQRQQSNAKPLPKTELPSGVDFEEGNWAFDLYDSNSKSRNKIHVICRASAITQRELPVPEGSEDAPSYAGKSFSHLTAQPYGRWICGQLTLPPSGIKHAESVGDAVQVFFVTACQPNSIEVAFAPAENDETSLEGATHFLLGPGDEFYVPSKNAYYLKNHSKSTAAELRFTILKPVEVEE